MTSDLQADLDALADAAEVIAELVGGEHGRALDELATRLRHLLDDRGIDQAPLTSEIIAWLEADPDHIVERWSGLQGAWVALRLASLETWRTYLASNDDQRQPGYRLGTRKPATERVRLDQCLLREVMWNGHRRRIVGVDTSADKFKLYGSTGWLRAAPDGTVEVLKVYPT
jgi:hypothetical protein